MGSTPQELAAVQAMYALAAAARQTLVPKGGYVISEGDAGEEMEFVRKMATDPVEKIEDL